MSMFANEAKKVAVCARLKAVMDMLNDVNTRAFFDFTAITDLGQALGVLRGEYESLHPLHCIKFADMPEGFKANIIEELDKVFGTALYNMGVSVWNNRERGAHFTIGQISEV